MWKVWFHAWIPVGWSEDEVGSGEVSSTMRAAMPWMARQQRLSFERVGVIDPLSLADYRAHGGYVALRRAIDRTLYDGASSLAGVAPDNRRFGVAWDAALSFDVHSLDRHISGGFIASFIGEHVAHHARALNG